MRLRCPHYVRWLHPVHPDTGRRSGCRLCWSASDADASAGDYPRARVAVMVCAFCACAQRCAPACGNPECTAVGRRHSYYCSQCHLWENDAGRLIYHCAQCGICRVGMQSDYRHCDACAMCVPRGRPHRCWGGAGAGVNAGAATEASCPICFEDMRCSRDSTLFLQCGHAAHSKCLLRWWGSCGSAPRCMTCRAVQN